MFYVSSYNNGMWGITDTDDGSEEFYTVPQLMHFTKDLKIQIKGVTPMGVKVVNASKQVAQKKFDSYADVVKQHINRFSADTCMNLAKTAHFVKKIKGLDDIDEIRRITMENIYPPNVQEVVASAQQYSNVMREVDCTNPNNIISALLNNVCLVLQQKTNGVLTAFICSANLSVLDKVYEPGFFDTVYLTKRLYDYTYNIEKVRPMKESTSEKNPNYLNVMSCSLRFRKDGVNHDKDNKVLSSPFYTVNIPSVLAMFILDNPSKLGNQILPEFYSAEHKIDYDFDFNMYNDVKRCLIDGTNYFGNEDVFLKYVDTQKLTKCIPITDIISRFQNDFDYMTALRYKGCSIAGINLRNK